MSDSASSALSKAQAQLELEERYESLRQEWLGFVGGDENRMSYLEWLQLSLIASRLERVS